VSGPGGFGLLLAAIGVGAALGPLLLARLVSNPRRLALVFGPLLLRGLVDLVLATTRSLAIAMGALAAYGVGTSTGMVTYNSLLQAEAGHDRGDARPSRRNATDAGVANVEFLKGQIEAIPLPAATVDVVISNCVINLSVDKPAVFAETYRVLKPGGRIGVSDIVAEDHLTAEDRAERGSYVGCIAGALTKREYETQLAGAGFADVSVTFTHQVADGLHSAIIKAAKPVDANPAGAAAIPTSRTSLPLASGASCC
jgi:SAM-dependent methyltransferase